MKKRKNQFRKGSSIVETAFVLPILILFTLAIMGYGLLFLRVQQITNAARHGARLAARFNNDTDELLGQVQTGVANCLTPFNVTYNEPPSIPTGVDPGTGMPVTVTVTGIELDFLNLSSLQMLYIPIPDSFTASVTMAKEGP